MGNLKDKVFVCPNVAGVATLRDRAIRVRRSVGVHHVGAVVLLIAFAIDASHVRLDLSSHTDAVADFDGGDILADLDRAADDFVADAQRERDFAPAAGDRVDVAAADAAGIDCNVNVAVFERLEFELGG